jgi:hypothetical protein
MTEFVAEDIPANGTDPQDQSTDEKPDYGYLFNAPNYADFIKVPTSGKAKDYEKKTAALLKGWFWSSVHSQQMPDAATILERGPSFSVAAGKLAASNDKVAKMLDLITAPESPAVIFVAAAIPFIAQIFRNHEPELAQVPAGFRERRAARKARKEGNIPSDLPPKKPLFTIKLLGRKFDVGVRLNFRKVGLGFLVGPARAQTSHPGVLVQRVFSDERVQKALEKEGIFFLMHDQGDPQSD